MTMISGVQNYRAIWISDVHLGTRGCKAEFLLDFLKNTESDYLYLVGDMVDGWRLRRSWYWPQAHNDVVQKLLRKARKGTKVYFIPGNHDEFARDYLEFNFGEVQVLDEFVHVTADGRRFLIMHGDQFDGVVKYAKWLAHLGDHAYAAALALNRWFNWARRNLGYDYWSLSAYLKHKVKNAVQFIAKFEEAMTDVARQRGVDGVVCGHIHHAELRQVNDICTPMTATGWKAARPWSNISMGGWKFSGWTESRQLSLFDGRVVTDSQTLESQDTPCEYSSSLMRGIHRSMGLFARLAR